MSGRTFSRRLRTRVVLGALGGAMISVFAVALPIARFAGFSIAHRQVELLGEFSPDEARRCEANPAWRRVGPGWSADAYSDAGVPRVPAAPPVDALMWAEARWLGRGGRVEWEGNSKIVQRFGQAGPCAWLVYRWRAGDSVANDIGVLLVIFFVLASGLLGGGGAALLSRTIAHAVDAITAAARRVGAEGYRRPVVDPVFADVVEVLDAAHRRWEAEVDGLRSTQQALETHLDEVAHDLRTPLSSLQLRIEAAQRGDPVSLAEAMADVTWLTQLVGNLHQATRLQRDARRSTEVDLGDLVARVTSRFAVIGRRTGVSVACNLPSEPVCVAADEDGLEQAVSNLVHNAVVHRPAGGGHVAILVEGDAEGFTLRVLDDGPGPVPSVPSTLAAHRPRDAGLGLFIVATVVARHGWTLQFAALDPVGVEACVRGGRPAAKETGR